MYMYQSTTVFLVSNIHCILYFCMHSLETHEHAVSETGCELLLSSSFVTEFVTALIEGISRTVEFLIVTIYLGTSFN